MTVYLLHLSQPMPRGLSPHGFRLWARHYIGWTGYPVSLRLQHHRNGTGARFCQVAAERGIALELARTWEGAGRDFERRLKRQKNAARLCPICRGGP
jgi:hypothetical protein